MTVPFNRERANGVTLRRNRFRVANVDIQTRNASSLRRGTHDEMLWSGVIRFETSTYHYKSRRVGQPAAERRIRTAVDGVDACAAKAYALASSRIDRVVAVKQVS